ncbi:TPA: hypothetical protein ACKROV_000533 [Providencia alcalifaciens]
MDFDLISFESMIAAKNAANWAFGAMIGTWFSGIATLAAVLFSLITVKRNTKVSLVASAGFRTEITPYKTENVLYFKVANNGIPSCHVSNIGWAILKSPRFMYKLFNKEEYKHYWHQSFIMQNINPQCWPARLEHGEQFIITIPIDYEGWVNQFHKNLTKKEIKKLKFSVTTTIGQTLYFSPDDYFINEFIRIKLNG